MRKLKQKIYQYTAVFELNEEGGYTVTVPALPGCITEGNTFEEATKNVKEAATLYVETVPPSWLDGIKNSEQGVVIAPVQIRI
ncbi:MAG: type II toxin-antitoxin system HicB family antitoxin [Candidatus Colwellbacteria bacterium]|nr:type II toxin-antitoxin system HicB family antitoxin [Candidatus Colwellbacteria bacterium]